MPTLEKKRQSSQVNLANPPIAAKKQRVTKKRKPEAQSESSNPSNNKKSNKHNIELGKRGEDAAVRFLELRGYSILERNWTCFAGEADIIALDDEAIHFIEVKTRMGEGKGFAAEAVTSKKRRRYEAIAELYLSEYEGHETGVTFDIIAINVLPHDRAYLRIYKNVLSCDCL